MAQRRAKQHSDPAPHGPIPARELAFRVLDEYRRTGRFVAELLDRHTAARVVSPEDRRLAMELINGVVRRQSTLDAVLRPHVNRPRPNIEDELWTLMQLGAYQLVCLSSIPVHAALHETVELAKGLGRSRWSGFLNAVLRSVSRSLTDQFTGEPAADAVPLSAGRYRRMQQPIFPQPHIEPAQYFAQAFSFPLWLVRRWQRRMNFDELVRLGQWFNAPAKLCLRVNSLRTTRDALLADFAAHNVPAHAGKAPQSVWLDGPARVEDLPGFAKGAFTVQDETAMRAATLVSPRPGETVLDLCAAPGSKTTHLAELMQNQGRIVATDVHPERLKLVEDGARRLGVQIIETRPIAHDGSDLPPGPFDAVLLDVPCSNTGVLGKRPEARWRISGRDIEELAALQQRLLTDALDRLTPGGRAVYSTCSIEPEENHTVVETVLAAHPGVRLLEDHTHPPGQPADGGYQALIQL